jgi:outer membrane receptor for ferrienterochelin and colicins
MEREDTTMVEDVEVGMSCRRRRNRHTWLAALIVGSALTCAAVPPAPGAPATEGQAAKKNQKRGARPEAFDGLALEQLLDTQVVTTTKEAQGLSQAPGIVTVITREEILGRSYRSVAEALRSVPGLFVNRDYVLHDVGVRGISGGLLGGSRLVKVMINSQAVSFRSETTHLLGPELIPIDAVERIEVVLGPGSALYGANAFLGVINIITRAAGEIDGASVGLRGSIFRDRLGGGYQLLAGKQLGPLDLVLAVSQAREDRSGLRIRCTTAIGTERCADVAKRPDNLWTRSSFDDLAQTMSIFGSLVLDIGGLSRAQRGPNLGQLELQVIHQLLDSRGSFSTWGALTHVDTDESNRWITPIPGSGNRVALSNTLVRGGYRLSTLQDRLTIALGGAFSGGGASDREHLRDRAGNTARRSSYGFNALDFSAEARLLVLKDLWRLEGWGLPVLSRLSVGLGMDHASTGITFVTDHQVQAGGRLRLSYDHGDLTDTGVWGQLLASFLGDRLSLVAGVRHDDHLGLALDAAGQQRAQQAGRELCDRHVCYQRWSYRFGATIKALKEIGPLASGEGYLLDELYAKLLYGTAYKAPSPGFLYGSGYLGDVPLHSNPALAPQDVESFEVQLGALMLGRSLAISATYFESRLSDKVEFAREAGLSVWAQNGAPVESRGVELAARYQHRHFAVDGGMAYQHSRKQLGDNFYGRITDTFAYPDVTATLGLLGNIPWVELKARIGARYVGTRTGHYFNRSGDREADRYELPPYLLADLDITTAKWRLTGWLEARFALSIRNLFDTRFDYPSFQAYHRYDIPGEPREVLFSIALEL